MTNTPRIVLNNMHNALNQAMQPLIDGENDEPKMWERVRVTVDSYIKTLPLRRIKVICDETNNTPETIAKNEMYVSFVDEETGEPVDWRTLLPNET